MALATGDRVGPYEITGAIGAGGMGEVYRARDARLGRDVALKVLPEPFAHDAERMARFQREAKVLASLNHPNIASIYGLEDSGSRHALVMELVEGPTLADRIKRGPIPIDESLRIAAQITEALEYAHERGIVHRDLKPANVSVTNDDAVKILDFGLAKALQDKAPSSGNAHVDDPLHGMENFLEGDTASTDIANSPTLTGIMTRPGILLGTAAYMSPDQAKGKAVDRRADIWAFGCVLYEMLTGQIAFRGESATDTLAAVIKEEPDWSRLPVGTPIRVRVLLQRCLQKDPKQRLQAIGEARIALDEVLSGVPHAALAGAPPVAEDRWRRALPWALACVAMVSALALLLILIVTVNAPPPVSGPLVWKQITFSTDHKGGPIITDGTRLYFQTQDGPVEMSVNGGPTAPLRASVSGMGMMDISPDGSEMLAWKKDLNDETGRGSLWSVPVLGGYPTRLGNQTARGADWSADGRMMVYADLNSVYVGDGDGANVRKVWDAPGEVDTAYFSPDSRLIAVSVVAERTKGAEIWELKSDGGSPHRLDLDWPEDADQWDGQWTLDGKHFIFLSNGGGQTNIYEVIRPPWLAFWKKSFAVRLTEGQINVLSTTPSRDSAGLFMLGEVAQGAMQTWDPAQKRFVPFLGGLAATEFVISPDKKWMVYVDYPQHHLWRSRLDGSERFQLTDSYSIMPQWSPDSKKIAYSDWNEIYLISADGGIPEKLIPNPKREVLPAWSPDGKSIAFSDYPLPGQPIGIKVLDLATRKISIMPGSQGVIGPSWSPDGKHMVAAGYNPTRVVLYSAQTGTWNVLRVFNRLSGNWVWSNDSQSLYFDMPDAGPEQVRGFYRLAIADGAWSRIASYDPLVVTGNAGQGVFPSITSEGQPAIMIDTSVDQIYSAKWN
jgi:eukaryotic-like serine/threonine-protein kinase